MNSNKKLLTASLLLCSSLFMAMKVAPVSSEKKWKNISAQDVLQKTAQKLNSLQNISYNLSRELNYSSENYHAEQVWNVYIDFRSTDSLAGFKYQIEDKTGKYIFNGTERFDLDKTKKSIDLNSQPKKDFANSLSYFYNSILTLRNVLPLVIADEGISKSVKDSIINNEPCFVVTLFLQKRRISNSGKEFDAMQTKSNFIYQINIDKKTYLPLGILQKNDLDNDFIKTSYSNIKTENAEPQESSWFYSTYTDEYKAAKGKEPLQLIAVGSDAPKWSLPFYNKNEQVEFGKMKGKVILLDFWIKNCGPCIESIPHLKALQEKFKDKNFELLSINSYDRQDDVTWFCNKQKPNYKVLMNGKNVAENYGVSAFPTIVLIGKNGKVVYSGGFDKSKIEEMIEKEL